ncbi:MAG: ACT domain-containing protein [Planctomycetes bacterium]|nr:ACT domain-containing protein [Planctomycetota bacterium]
MKIAFHGQRGSYAEAAAAWMYAGEDIATVPVQTVQGVLDALGEGTAQYGVIRLDTQGVGASAGVLDLVRHVKVHLVRETRFHERYNLAGPRTAKRQTVKRIYAHPTILALCGNYLGRQRDVEIIARYDSAEMLAGIAQRNSAEEAVVCGDFAASIYGLAVLQAGIENTGSGSTRFVSLSTAREVPKAPASEITTSVLFELKHEPGTLMAALSAFKNANINLNVVSSWPSADNKWDRRTYVEFTGRFDDPEVQQALKDLQQHTNYVQLLGSYDTVEPRLSSR